MKDFAGLLFVLLIIAASHLPSPMDKVRAIAGRHETTVTLRNGYYWVEVEGMDEHGTGKTVDNAAYDWLTSHDIYVYEPAKPEHTDCAAKECS